MTLLQGGELLQRERVDPTELGELPLRVRQAPLLNAPVERDRGVVEQLAVCRLRPRIPRHELVRTVLGDEHVLVERELRRHTLQQAVQVELLLMDLQLQTVHALRESGQSFPQ
ncbi:Uncharacterised protein [Mycobacterium tuberculosis]|nr:Uncharacterised protein [Mycobacterium tuberculosis]